MGLERQERLLDQKERLVRQKAKENGKKGHWLDCRLIPQDKTIPDTEHLYLDNIKAKLALLTNLS